jgi:hypothetical protein
MTSLVVSLIPLISPRRERGLERRKRTHSAEGPRVFDDLTSIESAVCYV